MQVNDGRHPKPPDRKLSVLLLEDDDADAYLTLRALSSLPQVGETVRARNGQEAVGLLQSRKVVPDIAFVDLQMPTMDGLAFLTSCVDQGLAAIPLVVLTSSSAVNDALRSRVRGALRVITKPERPSDLKDVLRDAIDTFVRPPEPPTDWERQAWFADSHVHGRETPAAAAASAPQFGRRNAQARP